MNAVSANRPLAPEAGRAFPQEGATGAAAPTAESAASASSPPVQSPHFDPASWLYGGSPEDVKAGELMELDPLKKPTPAQARTGFKKAALKCRPDKGGNASDMANVLRFRALLLE